MQLAAALKTRVRVLFRRQAEEEYEEDMRHPADGGSSDGARCYRCAVSDASFLCVSARGPGAGVGVGKKWRRHATRRTGGTGGGAGC